MQKITKVHEVYDYSELSKEARKKALDTWNEGNDLSILQSILNGECGQLLKEKKITCTTNHPVCLYSLSYCQGDGLMFEGTFKWGQYNVTVKHTGRYYHSRSHATFIVSNVNDKDATERIYKLWDEMYQSICKVLENYGYNIIEDETSEAHFIDECNENNWLFIKDGTLFNPQ